MARELTGDGLAVECLNCGEAHEQDSAFCAACQEGGA